VLPVCRFEGLLFEELSIDGFGLCCCTTWLIASGVLINTMPIIVAGKIVIATNAMIAIRINSFLLNIFYLFLRL
jgi:hypothetical protein